MFSILTSKIFGGIAILGIAATIALTVMLKLEQAETKSLKADNKILAGNVLSLETAVTTVAATTKLNTTLAAANIKLIQDMHLKNDELQKGLTQKQEIINDLRRNETRKALEAPHARASAMHTRLDCIMRGFQGKECSKANPDPIDPDTSGTDNSPGADSTVSGDTSTPDGDNG